METDCIIRDKRKKQNKKKRKKGKKKKERKRDKHKPEDFRERGDDKAGTNGDSARISPGWAAPQPCLTGQGTEGWEAQQ